MFKLASYSPSSIHRIAIIIFTALSLAGLLYASSRLHGPGFPLDDAWIHQTYARNLAYFGQWAFIPGQPSAGSTSPLWSALLAIGYLLDLAPYAFTYFLGWLVLLGMSFLGMTLFRKIIPDRPIWALAAGILLAFEWHLVWAAASGMETLLFSLLALATLTLLIRLPIIKGGVGGDSKGVTGRGRNWVFLTTGLLISLSVWLRPDGLTLLGPAVMVALLVHPNWQTRLRAVGLITAGFAILFLPYMLFNQAIAGAWWPNTFYAKQAEYDVLRQLPLSQRLLDQAILPLVGAGTLLLPGFVYISLHALKKRSWGLLAAALWFLGYLGMYALRLPVTYQHGRYVIPAMPVFFILGLAGLAIWLDLRSSHVTRRIVSRTYAISLALVLLAFWGLGANAYARDVGVIETEMVSVAHWVDANTEPHALVAAHDIGALGFFASRPLLDLAGLVSPEVIPFIRNEDALADYLESQGADYLVTFPSWYPQLTAQAELIYQSGGEISLDLGYENMAVYRWVSKRESVNYEDH